MKPRFPYAPPGRDERKRPMSSVPTSPIPVARPSTLTPLALALLAVAGDAGAQTRSATPRPRPIIGAVAIGSDDAAHPYTNRAALARRSRPVGASVSLDLPSLARASQSARNVLLAARGFMGTPYVWGGASPGGFDCSGFTRYVFALTGVTLPRNSREQLATGTPVAPRLSALVPGDLVFFANSPKQPVSHVGIYAGEGRMIHASGRGRAVRVDDLLTEEGRWYATHMVAARRILAADEAPAVQQ